MSASRRFVRHTSPGGSARKQWSSEPSGSSDQTQSQSQSQSHEEHLHRFQNLLPGLPKSLVKHMPSKDQLLQMSDARRDAAYLMWRDVHDHLRDDSRAHQEELGEVIRWVAGE